MIVGSATIYLLLGLPFAVVRTYVRKYRKIDILCELLLLLLLFFDDDRVPQ